MSAFVNINNTPYYEGSVVSATDLSGERDLCPSGMLARIIHLVWKKTGSCQVGLFAEKECGNWHNMDGDIPSYRGYWLEDSEFEEYFKLYQPRVTITGQTDHRGKDLQGHKGVYLCPLDDTANMPVGRIFVPNFVFIELDENIGANGCDGMGKKGHCVLVRRNLIEFENPNPIARLSL